MIESVVPAERVLLGGMLLDASNVAHILSQRLTSDHFSEHAHKLVFESIRELFRIDPEGIDPVTVSEHLINKNQLHLVGGYEYLDDLTQGIPRTTNLSYYLAILHDRFAKKTLLQLCHDVLAMDSKGTALAEQRHHLQTGLDTLFEDDDQNGTWHADAAAAGFKALVKRCDPDHDQPGISSGFPALDDITLGWWPQTLNILAARPAIGKTALAVSMAAAAAETGPVVYYSFEMAAGELINRWQAMEAEVNLHHLRAATLSDDEWHNLRTVMGMPQPDILYVDNLAPTAWAIQTHLHALLRTQQVSLIIIDHLHEMHAGTHGRRRPDNRNQEITHIVQSLKHLARRYHLPIVLLSQLNRDIERRRNARPKLADLRDSGSIEQSADLVMFLHRPDATTQTSTEEEPTIQTAELIIAKHRNGPTGTVPLTFWKQYAKFSQFGG